MATSTMVIAPGVAQASGEKSWTRSCGTKYTGYSGNGLASTSKNNKGTCAGHAWVRGRIGADNWLSWTHGEQNAVQADSRIYGARHKGCEDCAVYTT
ncbi:MAG: hypothetical protein ABIQ18_11695 [Umezawaea sp.]